MNKAMLFEEFVAQKLNENKLPIKVGDIVGNTVQGFNWKVLKIKNSSLEVQHVKTGEKKETHIDNMYKSQYESVELNESTINRFKPEELDKKNEIDHKFFKKLMPKTESTSDSATSHIWSFEGNTMFVHYQYHIVKPLGNSPDRPTYRLGQSQYWLNDTQLKWQGRHGEDVNVTLLNVYDITDKDNEKRLGSIYVDTKEFLNEMPRVFEIIDRKS
jgi:hypothetical protein